MEQLQRYRKLAKKEQKKKSFPIPQKNLFPLNSIHIKDSPNFYLSTMPTLKQVPKQNSLSRSSNTQANQKLFKGFQTEAQIPEEQKKRKESISNLITILQHKQSSQAEVPQINSQKKSDSEDQSVNSASQKFSENKQQSRDTESKQSVGISFFQSIKDKLYADSGSKPKIKFAKLHSKFNADETHIITSSCKSFCLPSKSSVNMNSKSNQASNFLTPGNNLPSNKKQVTSAGNLVEQEENQNPTGGKTNQSAFGNKSVSSQFVKQTTFAALPQKTFQQQQNPNGISLYEQVLAKNFEVIGNLLRNLNKIYSNQQEYENSLAEITERLHKIETDSQNIHHEFRTSHFMIDKKLNSITNEYSNMLHYMNLLKKTFKENGGRGSFFMGLQGNIDDDNQSNLNSRRRSSQRKNSKRCSGSRISQRNSNLILEKKQSFCISPRKSIQKQRSSMRKSRNMSQRVSNQTNLKRVDEKNMGNMLLQQINESGSWEGSQSDSSYDSVNSVNNRKCHQSSFHGSQQSIEYHQRNSRLKNRSEQQKKSRNGQKNFIDNFGKEDIDVIKSYISNEVIKMSSDSEINKFALLGIETTITKKFETFEQKIDEKLFQFKRDCIEQRTYKKLIKSIIDQLEQKTLKMIEKDISALKEQTFEKISNLEKRFNKQMQKKCDKQQVRQDLKQILESMNRKVNTLMDEFYHKFAQRNQSKRAILFLEEKINKLIETAQRLKTLGPPAETAENIKCLSCSKNVSVARGHSYTQSQPMLTQIHCATSQQKDSNSYGNDYLETASKNQLLGQNYKPKVKFTNISNLHYGSISQIFDKNEQHRPESPSPKGMNRLASSLEKPMIDTGSSSKEMFGKKLKNSQNSEGIHFRSTNSHLKRKVLLIQNENRPTTCMNGSVHEAKSWKSKATNILQKECVDWRSKRHQKKAA